MIKIAMLAPYSAGTVLPEESLKPRVRHFAKQQHPAPWVHALCRALSGKKDIDLKVFSHSRDITRIHEAEKEGVKYIFVPKYEPVHCDPYHLYLPAFFQILPLLKRYNPDIVHGFGTENLYGFLAVSQKKPSVVFIQGIREKLAPYYPGPKLKLTIRKKLEQYTVNKVDGLIVETDFACRWAHTINPHTKVKIIPHAYTESFFAGRPNFEHKRIICVGTLRIVKGCDTVLESFYAGIKRNPKLFKKAKLFFIGRGPLEQFLKSKARDWEILENVRFMGSVAHEKIIAEMENACMMVIGSRVDTSPNVITEAHSVGIPVVGTNGGGIPEMIEEGKDGFIVPVDDAEKMSRKMEVLLKDMNRCAEMGRAGREKVRRLNDPSRIADEHITFYKEILSGKSQ